MALATRCNSCGTVFRVVQDQLRVSEGWVRCGRCSAVFNAALDLFDLDNGAPVQLPPVSMPPPEPDATPAQPDWRATHEHRASPGLAPPTRPAAAQVDEHAVDERHVEPIDGPQAGQVLRHPDRHAERLPPASALLDPSGDAAAPAAIVAFTGVELLAGGAPMQVDADETMVPPSFVRAAERAAFWRQPSVRAGLLGSAALLAVLLLAQAGVAWRDLLAAHVPASRPVLETLCGVAGCTISPLRRIERLSVDSSGLSRLEGTPLYRLSLVLRSRADTALLAPALDLSLTDSQGRLVLRRVLQGAELGLQRPVIEAGQELPLQLLLAVGEQRVTGYTVELFYP